MRIPIHCVSAGVVTDDVAASGEGRLRVRYEKAPILEAALDFRWQPKRTMDAVQEAVSLPAFASYEKPKSRRLFNATFDLQGGEISQGSADVGFELSLSDGSGLVLVEADKFVFVERAPYDRWETFSQRAIGLLEPVVANLNVKEFVRIGLRFVNRIDIPYSKDGNFNTDEYITVKFDGPRTDRGIVNEFQMRVVKPCLTEGLSYALVVATTPSPVPNHEGIILDIDVFTQVPVPSSGSSFSTMLSKMRDEKNDIFHKCLKPAAVALFGGVEE